MAGKFQSNGRRRRRLNPSFVLMCLISLAVVLFIVVRLAEGSQNNPAHAESTNPGEETKKPGLFQPKETEPPTEPPTQVPTAPTIVSTATLAATGDVLMHMPVVDTGKTADGYDFTKIFQYLDDYSAATDYAVANLETTLAGTENGYAYSGYPCFNCPDEIADALKAAGFGMILTANNHCYDTRTAGLIRTVETVRATGLDTLGTHATTSDPKHIVKDLGGIQVGMVCYTYATGDDYPDRASMNGILTAEEAKGLINFFDYDRLEQFYDEVSDHIRTMKAAGAEAVVMYIHWGEEYQLQPNSSQTAIAQKLCDLGIDVIVGGHPHVVQPVDLLTSTVDPDRKTVCLYSMGNAISNQRREIMNLTTGHTEDGMLFRFTFAEYSDGSVRLDSVDILPTWVYKDSSCYRIIPLDTDVSDWGAAFNLSQSGVSSAKASYERTMALVGEGLQESNEYLTAQREAALSTVSE